MPQVLTVIHGESSLKTAHAARELGYALQDREDDDEMEPGYGMSHIYSHHPLSKKKPPCLLTHTNPVLIWPFLLCCIRLPAREHDVRKVCDLYMAELITSLVQMLVDEDRLKALASSTAPSYHPLFTRSLGRCASLTWLCPASLTNGADLLTYEWRGKLWSWHVSKLLSQCNFWYKIRFLAQDEYTFLLTALRQYSGASKRIANQLVLQATPLLLKPFQIGYAADPNGYTAPELVSMWSSVLNDVGRAQCLSAMTCLVPAVQVRWRRITNRSPCLNVASRLSVCAWQRTIHCARRCIHMDAYTAY